MDSTRRDGIPKDVSSFEKKRKTDDTTNKLVQELVDKVVAALEGSKEYFLDEKHALFLQLPSPAALRLLNVALYKRGVTLDPSSLIPHRGLSSYQTGYLLKKISPK